MGLLNEAKRIFDIDKSAHFTNYTHCTECLEHDETLRNKDIETIGLEELGNPGWDPICFANTQGFKYYLPALVRLCIESTEKNYYIDQFLFHISYGAMEKNFLSEFDNAERDFVAKLLNHLLDNKSEIIDQNLDTDALLSALEVWNNE